MRSLTLHRYVIVALIAAIAIVSFKACVKRGEKIDQYKEAVQVQNGEISRYHDAAGHQHAKVALQQADINFLKALHAKEIDSILYLLKAKDKQLQSITMAGLSSTGSIKPSIDTINVDSSNKDYNIVYNDRWLSLKGSIGSKNYIKYSYRDSLVFTTLKTKRLIQIDAFSLNPNTTFTSLTSLRVPIPKPKRFGIGPYVGYGYNGERFITNAGLSIHYSLISF
jgi:hypothetical protein